MNQKAHITGGIILAGTVMFTGVPPLTASLVVFGTLFNDLDYPKIPFTGRYHRKLFHNIYVIGLFLALSVQWPFLLYWASGMLLHDVMDMFSGGPVYLLWPVPYKGEHIGIGGWGVPNKSPFSLPLGVLIAVLLSIGYVTATGHLGDAISLLERLYERLLQLLNAFSF
jgi:hypothetical protein